MKTLILIALAGCSWTQFDDLEDQTPVRAQEKPDGNKSSDYGTAIAGATTAGDSDGGKVAVLSSGPGNYSTLQLDTNGKDLSTGDNETLGLHTIETLTPTAMILFDGTSQIALLDNGNNGTLVAVTGTISGLGTDTQIPTPAKPDAAAFSNGQLIVAATSTQTTTNVFSAKGQDVTSCTLLAGATAAPISAAGLAIDGAKLWVYTKTGMVYGYELAKLNNAMDCTNLEPTGTGAMAGVAPNGGHVDIVASKFAVVTAYDLTSTSTGSVTVIDLTTMAVVGAQLATPGVHSSAFNTFDGQGLVVLGYPGRASDGVTATGAVDLYKLDATSGALSGTADATLSIPGVDANHAFGRAVTTTSYNGKPIVVASGVNTVYAFYQTSLYTKR